MRNIVPNSNKKFIEAMRNHVISVGDIEIEDVLKNRFTINTKVGKNTITIDNDNVYCYTIFSRYEDVEKAKSLLHYKIINRYSGKYNLHFSPTPIKTAIEIGKQFIDGIINN